MVAIPACGQLNLARQVQLLRPASAAYSQTQDNEGVLIVGQPSELQSRDQESARTTPRDKTTFKTNSPVRERPYSTNHMNKTIIHLS